MFGDYPDQQTSRENALTLSLLPFTSDAYFLERHPGANGAHLPGMEHMQG